MTARTTLTLVAALARNRVIGRDGRLPWHLPADLAHFKRLTLDKPIVMGRRTWESLPGLLPRRTHIVVSRDPGYRAPGALVVGSPEAAIVAAGAVPEVMVVGGAVLYRALLPGAERMELTLVDAAVDGDAWFPEWDPEQWLELSRIQRARDARNAYDLAFVRLERRRSRDVHAVSLPQRQATSMTGGTDSVVSSSPLTGRWGP
jgi:dihydrofolate reductase